MRLHRAGCEALDHVVRRLEHGELSALEAIDILLSEELTLRENSRIKTALRMGRLATIKTLAGFDFTSNPRSTEIASLPWRNSGSSTVTKQFISSAHRERENHFDYGFQSTPSVKERRRRHFPPVLPQVASGRLKLCTTHRLSIDCPVGMDAVPSLLGLAGNLGRMERSKYGFARLGSHIVSSEMNRSRPSERLSAWSVTLRSG